MTTEIDDARELAAGTLTDDELRKMAGQHSRAAELALEMREAERSGDDSMDAIRGALVAQW